MTANLVPLLPLRDIVVFPGMVVPLFVGREKSVAALEAAMAADKDIFLLAQLDPACDDPDRDDRFLAPDEQRHDHAGKHDDVAQGEQGNQVRSHIRPFIARPP